MQNPTSIEIMIIAFLSCGCISPNIIASQKHEILPPPIAAELSGKPVAGKIAHQEALLPHTSICIVFKGSAPLAETPSKTKVGLYRLPNQEDLANRILDLNYVGGFSRQKPINEKVQQPNTDGSYMLTGLDIGELGLVLIAMCWWDSNNNDQFDDDERLATPIYSYCRPSSGPRTPGLTAGFYKGFIELTPFTGDFFDFHF